MSELLSLSEEGLGLTARNRLPKKQGTLLMICWTRSDVVVGNIFAVMREKAPPLL